MELQFQLESDFFWTASAIFPSWREFQNRSGAYGSQGSATPSDGSAQVIFAPEGRGIEPPTESEKSLVHWVIENEASISGTLIVSLLKEYPDLQAQYGYSGEEKELMPDVSTADDFRNLIGLHSVNVHPLQKDGIPYVGFEFGCTWDDEHGLGILMHGNRTVEIGGADTAILLWIAERDAEKA
jgi:hypothetical protein